MDISLTVVKIISSITPWALPLSLVMLVISVVVDVFKKKFYWSKFALFFVAITIILLIIQISLTYKLTKSIINSPSQSSTSSETANWKTYTGKAFSIKYNKEYSYQESKTVSSPEYPNTYPQVKFVKTNNGGFTITVASNVKSLTLDNALGNGPDLRYTKDALAGKDIKRIKIDNVDAVLVEDLNVGLNGVSFEIIAIKDSNVYQLVSEGIIYQDFNSILSTFKFTTKTFKSEKGSFAIDLPSDMKVTERPERIVGGANTGEVWFTFEQFDEHAPSGLVVVYGKPEIDGKGGGCFDEKTGGGYTEEMIAGQKVQVCEIDGFYAAYFTHPSKKIEYWIDTARLSTEQLGTISEAVRKTLRFQ